jgi:WD40 repeat protein
MKGANYMKNLFGGVFIFVIFLSACSSSTSITPSKSAPLSTETKVQPAETATKIPPTSTFTPAPTATLLLPVGQLTPVPSSNTEITAENVKDIQEIASYYADDIDYIARLTKDNKFLFVADGDGVDKYDYQSMAKLAHIAIPVTTYYFEDFKYNPEVYFQNTNDGNWVLIDNHWLVDLRANNQPKIRDLLAEFPLKNLYLRTISLSPNGSLLMISDRKCSEACIWDVAKIINLNEGTNKDAPSLYGFASTISPDGQYIAFSNQVAVNIWRTSDFEKISTLKIDNPYSVSNIAFSEDSSLVVIGQKTNIKIYDVQTGDVQTTIQGLCETYKKRVMFAPNSPVRVVESSDCDSGVWLIDQGKALGGQPDVSYDFSNIKFNEDGRISSIPYPHSTIHSVAYEGQRYFQFLDQDTLVFDGGISTGRNYCALSLFDNSLKCTNKTQKYVEGQFLGSGQILGTDGQFYDYTVDSAKVEIRSQIDSSTVFYSLPWKGYIFNVEVLDPINKLIFYQVALNANINKEVIQDMETNEVIEKVEGETFFSSIVFSDNTRYAAVCQKISYSYGPLIDRLMIFDLTQKKVVYKTEFACSNAGRDITLSNDGNKLAAQYVYRLSGNTLYLRVLLLDISKGFKSQYFDVETSRRGLATAFTPDGTTLVTMCKDNMICFLNSSTGKEIYRLEAHSGITHIAFNKDDTIMATSSDWGLITLWAVPPFVNE